MKKNRINRGRSRLLLAAAVSTGMAVASQGAQAQSARNWIGNTDADLATAANWDTLPVSGDSWVFGAPGTAGTTLTNTLTTSTSFNVSGITFSDTAATTGYTIDSAHAGTFTLTGGITHQNATTNGLTNTIGSNIAVGAGSHTVALGGSGFSQTLALTGNLTGSGTLAQTGSGAGVETLAFSGDNSGFTGAFTQDNANSTRTAFNAASAGSASAAWTFNRSVNGGVALNFTNTTIHFGSLSGGAFIRANSAGTVTVEVGELNTSTTFNGLFQQGGASSVLALKKSGTGTLTLSGNNTYAGATTINAGTLALGAANRISDSSAMVLNGGTFATGGFSETLSTLTLSSTSTIDFGLGTSALVFADSSAIAWTGTLNLSNFDIGTDTLKFGSSNTALTASQLSAISLSGYTASLDASGFVTFTAVPEPNEFALAIVGLLGVMVFIRRRQQML